MAARTRAADLSDSICAAGRSSRSTRFKRYSWLGAGAITLGVGAAMASAAGVANADEGVGAGGAIPSSSRAGTATSSATNAVKPAQKAQQPKAYRGSPSASSAGAATEARSLLAASSSPNRESLSTNRDVKQVVSSSARRVARTISRGAIVSANDGEQTSQTFVDAGPTPAVFGQQAAGATGGSEPVNLVSNVAAASSAPAGRAANLVLAAGASSPDVFTQADVDAFYAALTPAYIASIKGIDPTGRFTTPANPDYVGPSVGTEVVPLADAVAKFGSAGFSRNSSGNLVYKNNTTTDVLVGYGDASNLKLPAAGYLLVAPGNTVTITAGNVASVVAPRLDSSQDSRIIAVAGPGYPAGGTAGAQTPAQLLAGVFSQLAQIRNTILRILKTPLGGVQSGSTIPTRQLYDKLRAKTKGATDGIAIEQYVTADGQKQMVVYLGGSTFDLTNQFIVKNLPSYNGIPDQNQVKKITDALNGDTSVKIMLVGFSQGGMDAQNIAANASFRNQVTTVVTFASPIVQQAGDYDYVHIWDQGDLVPQFTFPLHQSQYNSVSAHVFQSASPNDTALIYTLNIPPFVPFSAGLRAAIYAGQKLALHGDTSTYEQVSDAFDKAPGFSSVKADIAAYWNHTHVN